MLDIFLFNFINQFAGKWAWLDYFGIILAEYLGYVLLFVLVLLLLFNWRKHWKLVLEALVTAGFTRFVAAEIIRKIFFRPRPFVSLNFIPLINQSPAEASFPSGHASFYFALATIVYFYNKKLGILFFVISFFIALARVFVGVHWPSDILAGAILGIFTAIIIYKLFKKYEDYIFRSWRGV